MSLIDVICEEYECCPGVINCILIINPDCQVVMFGQNRTKPDKSFITVSLSDSVVGQNRTTFVRPAGQMLSGFVRFKILIINLLCFVCPRMSGFVR